MWIHFGKELLTFFGLAKLFTLEAAFLVSFANEVS